MARCWSTISLGAGVGGDGIGARGAFITTVAIGEGGRTRIDRRDRGIDRVRSFGRAGLAITVTGVTVRMATVRRGRETVRDKDVHPGVREIVRAGSLRVDHRDRQGPHRNRRRRIVR